MDLRTQMRRAAGYFADREAIVHGARRLTYAEAWARGVRLANALAALGLKPGERIATLEKNSIEAVDIYLASAIGNFIRVPLYARNRRESHAQMIGNTGARLAIVDEPLFPEIAGLDAELPDLERIIVRDKDYEGWLASASDQDPDPAIGPEQYCVIRHTGGTTGKPKGVAYSHRNWLAICASFYEAAPKAQLGDAVVHAGPLSHASGFLFSPIWAAGGRNVMIDAFEPMSYLATLEQEAIGYGFVAPTMLNAIVAQPAAYGRRFPDLKALIIGAAPLSERTALKSREVFGEHVLHSAYGQTEVLAVAAMGPKDWFSRIAGSTPLRSVGRPLADTEIEIRDADGRALGPDEEGEIVVRIATRQMDGFWNDPAETEKRMVDGWVRTGDIGTIDRNGFLYLLDRANDMIISGGFNIYPAELENVIQDHPKVQAAAVFGIPHDKWGETPAAVVVVAPGATLAEQEIIDLVAERLGSMKKPSKVVITTDPLPLSNVGKVLRSKLREPYWAGHAHRISGA